MLDKFEHDQIAKSGKPYSKSKGAAWASVALYYAERLGIRSIYCLSDRAIGFYQCRVDTSNCTYCRKTNARSPAQGRVHCEARESKSNRIDSPRSPASKAASQLSEVAWPNVAYWHFANKLTTPGFVAYWSK